MTKTIGEMLDDLHKSLFEAQCQQQFVSKGATSGGSPTHIIIPAFYLDQALETLNELRERDKKLEAAAEQAMAAIWHYSIQEKWERSGHTSQNALNHIMELKAEGKTVSGELKKAFYILQGVLNDG